MQEDVEVVEPADGVRFNKRHMGMLAGDGNEVKHYEIVSDWPRVVLQTHKLEITIRWCS